MTSFDRRTALRMLAAAPLASIGGCCLRSYPKPVGETRAAAQLMPPMLAPSDRGGQALRVIDVHAHFFNASDVPVRGFIQDCIGHSAPEEAKKLMGALGLIAERIAALAPTAASELRQLDDVVRSSRDATSGFESQYESERKEMARRVVEATRGSEFQRLYRQMSSGDSRSRSNPASPLSEDEVLDLLNDTEQPSSPTERAGFPFLRGNSEPEIADGQIGFLSYMLSSRWVNLQSYMNAYSLNEDAFGTEMVLGALVDFDYWLDCPPFSAQDDQVRVHQRLFELSGGYFRPVVAYNPWSDMNQDGAGLKRVLNAYEKGDFVAVKIYPPTGFRPAGNASIPTGTTKSRPDLKKLDATLQKFFAECTARQIPVIAHTAHSNGRDDEHDEFGGPEGWNALLINAVRNVQAPVISLGHFGGGRGSDWTQKFALLMKERPNVGLYADLGYWEELVCPTEPDAICNEARTRLKNAMAVSFPGGQQTVAARTMYATDWLMLSQVKSWPDYPAKLLESLKEITTDEHIANIFGLNALKCFPKLAV